MTDPALSFGAVAASYDRGRPGYPSEAVLWALGERPLRVLELGAGTGKLTEVLVELGHDVFATEPDEQMLDVLSAKLPDVRATLGTAEQIPVGDQQYDVVIAAQAFHWFETEAALAEISRVLAPGGRLVLLWNQQDQRIPWVRRLGAIIGSQDQDADPTRAIDDSALFSAVEQHDFRFWQVVNRDTIQDLALSRSNVSVLPPEEREVKRAEVLAFYDDYGRGMDGMQVPYRCVVFRSVVLEHARPKPVPVAPVTPVTIGDASPAGAGDGTAMSDTAHRLPRVVTHGIRADSRTDSRAAESRDPAGRDDGGSDELILIDFR